MLYFLLVDLVLGGITILYLLYSDNKQNKSLENDKEKCYNKANKD